MGFEKLTPKEKRQGMAKIENILASRKLFLKKDFCMPDLAKETGIQLYVISYLINSERNLNFKDYINLKRINYFKGKINDANWKDFSVEQMAFACGFRSRTTCYRAFKKHFGVSSSEYLTANRAINR
ncbi:helix-turn-helix domain-containing protein [Flavobacterium sp. CFBP9031]|uniref:helix-turn-helix domain-containing protein n=1 Tax=Flavobacterium sp. CFBP9031 TaxID=3096538 RepID=UPI002A69E4A9|nr:helix-turn-helix domain-containing protein [Flavobacterium sp. CFBP9031]MDY0989371.1 helix-turn-helix domain-containing protein [Flavobacterium sp. CFBP9031]